MANLIAAKSVYQAIASALDKQQYRYKSDPDNLCFYLGFSTDCLNIELHISIDPQHEVFHFISILPFTFPEDKLLEGAMVATIANHNLIHGNFDFDFSTGNMLFKLTNYYLNGYINEDCVVSLLEITLHTVNQYDDQFLAVAKGYMSISDFIDKENV